MILFILQNAYRSEKHPFDTFEEWERELWKSHTGKRLMSMIPPGEEYRVINASGYVGEYPSSCSPADPEYIQTWIDRIKPDVICACGKIAQHGLALMDIQNVIDGVKNIPLVYAPHPAWRLLSFMDAREIKEKIKEQLCLSRS
jgi:hypothetical protein